MNTTEEIARYAGEKYTSIGMYVKNGIMNLQIPTAPPPEWSEVTTSQETNDRIFNAKIDRYVKDDNMIVATMQALYNTVWGQCSKGLRSKLRSGTSYATYATTSNCIDLLKAIRAEMTGFKGRNYLASSIHSVMREFYLMTQGKHQSNQ